MLAEQSRKENSLWMVFVPDQMPSLEVLKLDVQCSLGVSIDPRLPLHLLVLVAAGILQVGEFDLCEEAPEVTTIRQTYPQSGAAFPPKYKTYIEHSDTAQP